MDSIFLSGVLCITRTIWHLWSLSRKLPTAMLSIFWDHEFKERQWLRAELLVTTGTMGFWNVCFWKLCSYASSERCTEALRLTPTLKSFVGWPTCLLNPVATMRGERLEKKMRPPWQRSLQMPAMCLPAWGKQDGFHQKARDWDGGLPGRAPYRGSWSGICCRAPDWCQHDGLQRLPDLCKPVLPHFCKGETKRILNKQHNI